MTRGVVEAAAIARRRAEALFSQRGVTLREGQYLFVESRGYWVATNMKAEVTHRYSFSGSIVRMQENGQGYKEIGESLWK